MTAWESTTSWAKCQHVTNRSTSTGLWVGRNTQRIQSYWRTQLLPPSLWQDILVCPDHQRQGVGRELFQRVFAPFQNVRQKVLMTDNDEAQIAFYESLGFTELRNLPHPPSVFCQIGRPPQL